MDASQHLPGCTGGHSLRQACNVPPAQVAEQPAEAVPPHPVSVPRPRHRPSRVQTLVGGGLLAAFVASAGVVIGLRAFSDPADSTGEALNHNELPSWARPSGAVELRNEPSCSDNASWQRPCRTMAFGVDRPYEEAIADVKAAYEAREVWGTSYEYHDLSLHVIHFTHTHCVVYVEGSSQAGYEAVIDVVLDGCGAR